MVRLPIPGSDQDNWGALLNEFLRVSHHENGSLRGTVDVVNIKDYGAAGDGETNDRPALQRAIDALMAGGGGLLYIPPGDYRIGPDPNASNPNALTISLHITIIVQPKARFLIDKDLTLTFGKFVAGLSQVFAGDGLVRFKPGTVKEVYPEWWGAVPDNNTDCSAAINKAIASYDTPRVYFSPGIYQCRNIDINKDGITLIGGGKYTAFLKNNGTTIDDDILRTPEDRNIDLLTIRDLGFQFMPGQTQGYAMHFTGLTSATIEDFYISAPGGEAQYEAGGLYFDTSCFLNSIANGKIYLNNTGIKLRGESLKAVNHNYFRNLMVYSRKASFITLEFAHFNLFEGMDCESFDQAYDHSLIEIKNAGHNMIRGGYFDLDNAGFAIVNIYGENDTALLARGNLIEANNINACSNYGIYLGDYTKKNIVRHNSFSNNGTDIGIKPGGLALYNEIYDNYFADDVGTHISAPTESKTLQLRYSEESDYLEMRPHIWAEKLTIGSEFYLNNRGMWSGMEANQGSQLLWGTGSPEGTVSANVGSLYLRTDGGPGSTLYVKESGNDTTTGWAAK